MNEEMDYNKTFKFVLQQDDLVLYERIFDANQISPYTRNSIDIRGSLSEIINKIQKVLSKTLYETTINVGSQKSYQLFEYYKTQQKKYPHNIRKELDYKPETSSKKFDDREVNGVSCKISLFINENLIVERKFYVDGFNWVSRWSVDLVETLDEIVSKIFNNIVETDVENMWDDYNIINKTGMTISQVRDLSNWERKRCLYKINN